MPINIQVSPQYQGVIEQAGAPQNTGVSPNFQSFNTLADIPADFSGTAQVGTQLYVGDGVSLELISNKKNIQLSPSSNGTLAVNIGNATISGSTGTNAKSTAQPFTTASGSSVVAACGSLGTETFDLTGFTFNLSASDRYIGLWIHRGGTTPYAAGGYKPIAVSLYFTGNGFINFSVVPMLIYPGTHFYSIPLPVTGVSSQVWNAAGGISLPGTVNQIRVKINNNAGVSVVKYGSGVGFRSPGSDAIYFGDLYINPPAPKAKFLICFDDCKRDLLVANEATPVVDYNGNTKSHSFASFAATYGYKVNAYIITGGVLNADTSSFGYLNARQLSMGADEYGIVYGAHSHAHPAGGDIAGTSGNQGLRILGPYGYAALGAGPYTYTNSSTGIISTAASDSSSIVNDLTTCLDYLNKLGFGAATKHFALPQGGRDYYVNNALEQFGFLSVRDISGQIPHGSSYNTYQQSASSDCMTPEVGRISSSIQLDATVVAQDLYNYIDGVIASGAVGTCYIHSFSGATYINNTKLLFDYLKAKQLLGLIDITTLDNI